MVEISKQVVRLNKSLNQRLQKLTFSYMHVSFSHTELCAFRTGTSELEIVLRDAPMPQDAEIVTA